MPAASTFGSIADRYTLGNLAPFASRVEHCGGRVSLVEARQPSGDMSDPPMAELAVAETLTSAHTAVVDLGDGVFEPSRSAGTFVLVPPSTRSRIEVEGVHEIRVAGVNLERYRQEIEQAFPNCAFDGFGSLHSRGFQSHRLSEYLLRLSRLDSANGADRLEADALGLGIIAELKRLAFAQSPIRDGALSRSTLDRCVRFLRDNLATEVDLASIAAVAGLSMYHFHRAFRQSTGEAPHAYLRRLRVEEAQRLLRTTSMSVFDIALCVGFQSPSSFSRTFRAVTGQTPLRWRREVC